MSKKLEKTTEAVAAISTIIAGDSIAVIPPTEVSSYKFMTLDGKKLKRAIESNLGNDGFNVRSLPQVKIPTGGITTWTIPSSSGEIESKTFNGVIIHWNETREKYKGKFGEAGAEKFPNCVSNDGKTGIGDPGGDCKICPFAQFGSRSDGKPGQECGLKRNLFIINQTSLMPIVVRLSVMSIKPADKYALNLLCEDGDPLEHVLTQFSLIKAKNPGGQDYSQVVLKKVSSLSTEEIARVEHFQSFYDKLFGQRLEDDPMSEDVGF